MRLSDSRHIIATGYLLIALLIGASAYIYIQEWKQMRQMNERLKEVHGFRKNVHEAYAALLDLTMLGETVLEWEESDTSAYRTKRLALDSLLCTFKNGKSDMGIDSMRTLLLGKETLLFEISRLLGRQADYREQISKRVPAIARESTQKPQKSGGFLGLFKKKSKQPSATLVMLESLHRDVVSRQRKDDAALSLTVDSLAARSMALNDRLQTFIELLDTKANAKLQAQEEKYYESRKQSGMLMLNITCFIILLLLISYAIIHRNITQIIRYRKQSAQMIAQLEQTASRNESLIASRKKAMHTITHELRTPLTAIHGYAELMQENEEEKTRGYADNILQAARRMTAMLNSLLDFFRLDSGKEQANVQPFHLGNIADLLQTEFAKQAEAKDLKLTVECPEGIILNGDKERIIQICDNLLGNAIKFTDTGNVSLAMSYDGNTLAIVVEDTGTGISKEEQQRVFGAFERLSNAATQDGFGLGLSIVKQIVGMLGGTIRLESEKKKGSCFTVKLPMNTADICIEEQTGVETPVHIEKPYYVIVLDDNPMVLSMIKEMYAGMGVHCDTFTTIGDAMDAMRLHAYDLMITDMKMPEINGYEVLELLRSSSVGNSKDIPVVVATASGISDEEELVARGFAACLFKPFAISELTAVSDRCLPSGTDRKELPDLTSLLAYGDKRAMLDRLINETEKDMRTVREIMERNDRKALNEWIHRQRSSWAVIRADKPLWTLYERLHRDEGYNEDELRQCVDAVLRMGSAIIELVQKERRLSDEDICD